MVRCALALWVAALAHGTVLESAVLEVENEHGDVTVTVVSGSELKIDGEAVGRPSAPDDTVVRRVSNGVRVVVQPQDGARFNLAVQLPLGFELEARTVDGAITVDGMLPRALLETDTGGIRLKLPWRGTRMTLDADVLPRVERPRGLRLLQSVVELADERKLYRLRDALPEFAVAYGAFRIKTRAPRSVRLEEFSAPADWPVKFPWQAQRELERILAPDHRSAPLQPPSSAQVESIALSSEPGELLFRSDVRLVNQVLAVNDKHGRPVTGLGPDDFEVFEDGQPQRVARAGSDDIPFNLAILLDLSGSAQLDEDPMKAAARGFVEIARPNDRIALAALSGGLFQVVSPLTTDRTVLLSAIDRLPSVTGPSPLYDAIVLAYAEELELRPGERNALIVISDGIDNQISKHEAPSSVKFKHLLKAAEGVHAIVYPIFLRSGERFGRGWSRKAKERMAQLAAASGGKLFAANSIEDLAPVFPKVESELRSVYSLAYYPLNQSFDGAWRQVEVRVKRPGVVVRARPGYWAR